MGGHCLTWQRTNSLSNTYIAQLTHWLFSHIFPGSLLQELPQIPQPWGHHRLQCQRKIHPSSLVDVSCQGDYTTWMGTTKVDTTEIGQKLFRQLLLTLVLNPDIPCLCKLCRSRSVALFVIKYVNLYQQPGSSNLTGWKLEVDVGC